MIVDRFRRLVRRLKDNERGNVLMIVGLSIVPLVTATGMGIDYSRAMLLQTKLEAVADAAAISALTLPMMKKPVLAACGIARNNFVAQATNLEGMVLDLRNQQNLRISISETYPDRPNATTQCPTDTSGMDTPGVAPLARTVSITFDGQSSNVFSRILGVNSLPVNGETRTQTTLAPYVDIHLVLDTSQSMGLAATPAGERALFEATKFANNRGCQFGCHVAAPGDKYATEAIANDLKIDMRVDVERKAALDMITTAQSHQNNQQLYRFGIYRIGRETTDIQAITNNLETVRTAVSGVKLGTNDSSGYGDTNLTHLFDTMLPKITVRGNGTSPDQARAFMFIVTDGVQDLCGQGHCMALVDPARCQAYKDANVTVGVIYTTYLPVRADPTSSTNTSLAGEYTWLISPLPPERIAPALEACASPGWYFEASNAAGIHTAMQKLFNQASQTPVIVR